LQWLSFSRIKSESQISYDTQFGADTTKYSKQRLGTTSCSWGMALRPLGGKCSIFPSQKPASPIFRESQSFPQAGLPPASGHRGASSGRRRTQKQRQRRWDSAVRADCCLTPEATSLPEQSNTPQSSAPHDPPTYVKAPGRIIASEPSCPLPARAFVLVILVEQKLWQQHLRLSLPQSRALKICI